MYNFPSSLDALRSHLNVSSKVLKFALEHNILTTEQSTKLKDSKYGLLDSLKKAKDAENETITELIEMISR